MDIINEIIKLKNKGLKNNEISEKLNIPVGTVKSKLFRYKNKPVVEEVLVEEPVVEPSGNHCKSCGKEIKQITGKKAKLFCSDYCRVKYWRMHKNDKRRV